MSFAIPQVRNADRTISADRILDWIWALSKNDKAKGKMKVKAEGLDIKSHLSYGHKIKTCNKPIISQKLQIWRQTQVRRRQMCPCHELQ